MSNKQRDLTDKEIDDLQNIVAGTLASVCDMADKHSIDRDSMLKCFADLITAFAEVTSIQNYKASHTNADRIRNMSDEELAEFLSVHDLGLKGNDLPMLTDWLEWLQSEAE